ncbi:MAG: putative transport system permease protein [Acidobacteriota bacterium]|jgi:putative ABC transport system permease protein|nr:putative transport system permease protein [Acidobacteriota bacterium]
MIRHLFKLVWNRKRTSALLILEIFFSFLVVFVVATLGMYCWDNYKRPLGFSIKNVWQLRIETKKSDDQHTPDESVTYARLLKEVQSFDAVESVAGAMGAPYEFGEYRSGMMINHHDVTMEFNEVTPELKDVLGLRLVSGRWFQDGDEKLSWLPVVIDRDLARDAFRGLEPIGQRLSDPVPDGIKPKPEMRVIGVVDDFRRAGELSGPGNYRFDLKRLGNPDDRPGRVILVKVRPGTPASFEEALMARAQGVAPEWSFEVKPLTQLRESAFRLRLTPLIVGGIVAFFLLLMVGLGLIGVLWQNLLQRTREIGLRRATGASRAEVHRQVLMEQILLTTLGVFLGTVLVAQIPILDLIGFVSGRVFAGGLLVAMVSIYLLSILCALYPSAMAARVQPADALRYE